MLCRPFRCECTFMIENGVLVRVQFEIHVHPGLPKMVLALHCGFLLSGFGFSSSALICSLLV